MKPLWHSIAVYSISNEKSKTSWKRPTLEQWRDGSSMLYAYWKSKGENLTPTILKVNVSATM